MAIIHGLFEVSGSIKGYTFSKCRNGKNIMRKRPGPISDKIKNSPNYEVNRKYQKEFKGCIQFSALCRSAFGSFNQLSDYNFHNSLVKIGKNIMNMDTKLEIGKRSLKLTEHKNKLEEFNFCRKHKFDKLVCISINCKTDRENLKAEINISNPNRIYNIQNKYHFPFFRILLIIGCVSDMFDNPVTDNYEPIVTDLQNSTVLVTGEWYSTEIIPPYHTMTIQLPQSCAKEITNDVNLVLSIALEFGEVYMGQPKKAEYGGGGKVLKIF